MMKKKRSVFMFLVELICLSFISVGLYGIISFYLPEEVVEYCSWIIYALVFWIFLARGDN